MSALADTSAWWASRRSPSLRPGFDAGVVGGSIATCDMVKLELLYSAQNPRDFLDLREELDSLPNCTIGGAEWRRAIDVYQQLCLAGQGDHAHRRVNHEDLLIAAAAEAAGLGVLHYDSDFEVIAAITGQETRWIAPPGSL
jgi:predicted nucleic acid-binding protein